MSFKKSLRNLKNQFGQVSIEYMILLIIMVTLTVMGTSSILSQVRKSGEDIFKKAVAEIVGQSSTAP